MKKIIVLIILMLSIPMLLLNYNFSEDSGQYFYDEEFNFSIIFPEDFTVKDGILDNDIIKKAISGEASIMVSSLNVEKKNFDDYSNDDFILYMNNLEKFIIDQDYDLISITKSSINSKPFIRIEYNNALSRYIGYFGFYNGNSYTIGSTQPLDSNENDALYRTIERSLQSFRLQKREGYTSIISNSDASDIALKSAFGTSSRVFIIIGLLLSGSLTYGFGIGVPYFIKRFFIKKMMSKKKALIWSVVWFFVQVFFWMALLDGGSSIAPMICSYVTYRVLLKDYTTDKETDQVETV